jgi:hypothetical protein
MRQRRSSRSEARTRQHAEMRRRGSRSLRPSRYRYGHVEIYHNAEWGLRQRDKALRYARMQQRPSVKNRVTMSEASTLPGG